MNVGAPEDFEPFLGHLRIDYLEDLVGDADAPREPFIGRCLRKYNEHEVENATNTNKAEAQASATQHAIYPTLLLGAHTDTMSLGAVL